MEKNQNMSITTAIFINLTGTQAATVHRISALVMPRNLSVWFTVLAFTTSVLMGTASAAAVTTESITGLWEQYDDKSDQLQTLIRITKTADGTFVGTIEKIIPTPGESPDPKCDNCRDHRHNKPILGMQIIKDLARIGEATYNKGRILDPDSGDEYRLKIIVLENGAKLDVRGYLGISLFGRSQVWHRAP